MRGFIREPAHAILRAPNLAKRSRARNEQLSLNVRTAKLFSCLHVQQETIEIVTGIKIQRGHVWKTARSFLQTPVANIFLAMKGWLPKSLTACFATVRCTCLDPTVAATSITPKADRKAAKIATCLTEVSKARSG